MNRRQGTGGRRSNSAFTYRGGRYNNTRGVNAPQRHLLDPRRGREQAAGRTRNVRAPRCLEEPSVRTSATQTEPSIGQPAIGRAESPLILYAPPQQQFSDPRGQPSSSTPMINPQPMSPAISNVPDQSFFKFQYPGNSCPPNAPSLVPRTFSVGVYPLPVTVAATYPNPVPPHFEFSSVVPSARLPPQGTYSSPGPSLGCYRCAAPGPSFNQGPRPSPGPVRIDQNIFISSSPPSGPVPVTVATYTLPRPICSVRFVPPSSPTPIQIITPGVYSPAPAPTYSIVSSTIPVSTVYSVPHRPPPPGGRPSSSGHLFYGQPPAGPSIDPQINNPAVPGPSGRNQPANSPRRFRQLPSPSSNSGDPQLNQNTLSTEEKMSKIRDSLFRRLNRGRENILAPGPSVSDPRLRCSSQTQDETQGRDRPQIPPYIHASVEDEPSSSDMENIHNYSETYLRSCVADILKDIAAHPDSTEDIIYSNYLVLSHYTSSASRMILFGRTVAELTLQNGSLAEGAVRLSAIFLELDPRYSYYLGLINYVLDESRRPGYGPLITQMYRHLVDREGSRYVVLRDAVLQFFRTACQSSGQRLSRLIGMLTDVAWELSQDSPSGFRAIISEFLAAQEEDLPPEERRRLSFLQYRYVNTDADESSDL
ncbi:hypothetical protein AAG570_008091 [Ranatra chinensis]|uniref:Uncharacterized protein n=1 Tax=Ranatra chinensis TaxID=642074 RepID=A0ABD0Y900_9HEMI